MKCPICGTNSRVLDTRREGDIITRHRECKKCGRRFHTSESLDLKGALKMNVLKQGGNVEPFSKTVIRNSLLVENLSDVEAEYVIQQVQAEIFAEYLDAGIVSSTQIGLRIIRCLFEMDRDIAAIRLACTFFESRSPSIIEGIAAVINQKTEKMLSEIDSVDIEKEIEAELIRLTA